MPYTRSVAGNVEPEQRDPEEEEHKEGSREKDAKRKRRCRKIRYQVAITGSQDRGRGGEGNVGKKEKESRGGASR